MTLKAPLFACALALCLALAIFPTPASATLLSTLISGSGTITVGTLEFGNFSYLNTGDMPTDAGVNVVAFTDGLGNSGLLFQGAFIDFLGGLGSDALIGFSVTELNNSKIITGASLAGNPAVLGGNGIASVTETFHPVDTATMLSIFAISPGITKSTDSGTFVVPHTQVIVQKDVLNFSAPVGGGVPVLSFITQTFHETDNNIPEPAAIVSLSAGLLTLGLYRLRRRRR